MSTIFSISVQLAITPCSSLSNAVMPRYIRLHLIVMRACNVMTSVFRQNAWSFRHCDVWLDIQMLVDVGHELNTAPILRREIGSINDCDCSRSALLSSRRWVWITSRLFARAFKYSPVSFGQKTHPFPPHMVQQTKNDATIWTFELVNGAPMYLLCKQIVMMFAQSWDHHHRDNKSCIVVIDGIIY